MANLSGDRAGIDLFLARKRIDEANSSFKDFTARVDKLRSVLGLLGVPAYGDTLTVAIQDISAVLGDLEHRLYDQLSRSSSPPGMGTEVRSNDC